MDKTTQDHVERITSDPGDVPQKHIGIDEELRKYVVAADNVQVDEVTSKRLRHMINKRVLIVMVGTYFLQSLDKNAISYAAIMGIQKDANLQGQDVSSSSVQSWAMLTLAVFLDPHGHILWYIVCRVSNKYHCAEGAYCKVPGGKHLLMGIDIDNDLFRLQLCNSSCS